MLEYLGLIPLGLLIGAFGTLIGAGGGFILVPALLILYPNANPEVITSISLAVVFFNALSGSWAYARKHRIHYRAGFQFSGAAIPGAILGALSTYYVPRHAFDAICGVLMLTLSGYLLWRPNKPNEEPSDATASNPFFIRYSLWRGLTLSFVVGYMSGLLGFGGGIVHVPTMVHLLDFPVHVATATSHFVLAITALTGTVVHLVTGAFSEGVRRTICLAIGVIIGAQIGAALSDRLSGAHIVRALAVALALVGVRVLLLAFAG